MTALDQLNEIARIARLSLDVRTLDSGRIIVNFARVEIKNDDVLGGAYGSGNTTEEAAADYLKQITGQRLIYNAYQSDRREIVVIQCES